MLLIADVVGVLILDSKQKQKTEAGGGGVAMSYEQQAELPTGDWSHPQPAKHRDSTYL